MSTPEDKIVQKPKSNAAVYAVVAIILIILVIAGIGYSAGWFKTKSSGGGGGPTTASCTVPGGQTLTSVPPGQTILGAGSTFVNPLMYTWTVDYTASTVTYSSVGSGTGITDLASKTVDFAASDAPLSPAQQVTDPNVVEMPESAGAVAIIYNVPGVSVALNFNGTDLANIYLGKITMWNDPAIAALNPGVTLPASAIGVVHRSDGSGTTFAFTEYLSAESPTWVSTIGGGGYATSISWPVGTGAKGSGTLANTVQTTPYTIGYVDLEYALQNGISFGKVLNPAGDYVLPSLNASANAIKDHTTALPAGDDAPGWYNVSVENEPGAADYPISTFTYLMAYKELSTNGASFTLQSAEALLSFWNWTIHAGQQFSGELYYVPLPANIVTSDQAELSLFTYNGAPVSHC